MSDGQLSFRKSANIDRVTDKRKDSLFRLVDTDGSGTIDAQEFAVLYDAIKKDLAEELEKEAALQKEASSARRRFKMLLLFVAVLVSFLAASVAANFAVIFTVVDQAITTTTTSTGLLEVKGSDAIAKTAAATQDVPLIVAPALDLDTLGQVKSLRVTYEDTYTPTDDYAQEVQASMSVVAVRKHNATFVEFITDVAGETIEVLNGVASFVRYPTASNGLEEALKFQICEANATCSAFRTSGIDVDAALDMAKDALVKAGFADASRRLSLSWTCGGGAWTMIDFCGLSYAPPTYNTDLGDCTSPYIDKVGGIFYTNYPAYRNVVIILHGKAQSGADIWPALCNGGDSTDPFDCPMLMTTSFRTLFFTFLSGAIVDSGSTSYAGDVGWSSAVEESDYSLGAYALAIVLCDAPTLLGCDYDAGYLGPWVGTYAKILALGFSDGAGFAMYLNYFYDSIVTRAICADYWAHAEYDTWLTIGYSSFDKPVVKANIYTHCDSDLYADGLAIFKESSYYYRSLEEEKVAEERELKKLDPLIGGIKTSGKSPMTIPYAAGLGWNPGSQSTVTKYYGYPPQSIPYKDYSWGNSCGAFVKWSVFGLPTSTFGPYSGGSSLWSSSCTYDSSDWPIGVHGGMMYATPYKSDILSFVYSFYSWRCRSFTAFAPTFRGSFRRLEEHEAAKENLNQKAEERRELRGMYVDMRSIGEVSAKAAPKEFKKKIKAKLVKTMKIDTSANKMDYTPEAKSAMTALDLTPPAPFVLPKAMITKLKMRYKY